MGPAAQAMEAHWVKRRSEDSRRSTSVRFKNSHPIHRLTTRHLSPRTLSQPGTPPHQMHIPSPSSLSCAELEIKAKRSQRQRRRDFWVESELKSKHSRSISLQICWFWGASPGLRLGFRDRPRSPPWGHNGGHVSGPNERVGGNQEICLIFLFLIFLGESLITYIYIYIFAFIWNFFRLQRFS